MKIVTSITSMLLLGASGLLSSCNTKGYYNDAYADTNRMELGSVQKEIQKGMSQDQVACALGTPNIVTFDKDQKENWIYDKIATQVRQSGVSGLILFLQTGSDYLTRTDTSQKTLTVVIKFDEGKQVESVRYHASQF